MKFTLPLALFALSTAVDAAAVADAAQEDKRWCLIRGQPCWKAKRAADVFTEAIKTSGGLAARDDSNSEAAFMAKRQIDSLALAIAASQGDPTAYYEALGLGDEFAAAEKPAEKATEKREANPWCLIRGQPCWKAKREAEPEAAQEDKRWCLIRGQPCWKAKRAAEAVINSIEASGEHDPRDLPFNPEARVKREASPWCLIRGQPCWKREASAEASCNAPDGACTLANRDLHAVYNIARSIVDAHSE